jgi:hypothetical protein
MPQPTTKWMELSASKTISSNPISRSQTSTNVGQPSSMPYLEQEPLGYEAASLQIGDTEAEGMMHPMLGTSTMPEPCPGEWVG